MTFSDDAKHFSRLSTVSLAVILLIVLVVILLIFEAGFYVGFRRATFSYNWNTAYFRSDQDPHWMFAPFMHDADDLNPHGAVGEVVSIALPTIMVKGPSSAEEVIYVSPTTTIRYAHAVASTSDLRSGENVIVIGSPDGQGRLSAAFIRILPTLTGTSTGS